MLSIRTQDRMALVPYNQPINIVYSEQSGKSELYWNKVGLLGTYATKERALEVLDEIEEAVCDNQNMFDEYVSSDYGGYNKRGVVKTVYQMPKE